jgi:hypothetical protein
VIHIHGTPLTPEWIAAMLFKGRHVCISFAHPEQIEILLQECQSAILDNGAFSAWLSGKPITDWLPFRAWIDKWSSHPSVDWWLIPDVIDGDERDNDHLIFEFREVKYGVPVWHLHESTDRILRLMDMGYDRIAIGSSGEYAEIGNDRWYSRMAEAMQVLCDEEGRPKVKLHGLRMLNPAIFTKFPFASADSTNVARNVGLDCKYKGKLKTANKLTRGIVLANNIESFQSAERWIPQAIQSSFLLEEMYA